MDRFFIGFLDGPSGLQTNTRPWLIADNSFTDLRNVSVFRGRLRKRFGSYYMGSGATAGLEQLLSRLRIPLSGGSGVGITDGSGNASGTVPGNLFKQGQMFSIGTALYTVSSASSGVQPMLQTVSTTTATYNISNGAYNFVGAPATTQIYFYPSEPVMGITNYENGPINNQPSYAFDTQFAYLYSVTGGIGSWNLSVGSPTWHSSNSQFFWICNWFSTLPGQTTMYVTNFNATVPMPNSNDDPMYYFYNGTWTAFIPYFLPAGGAVSAGPFVKTAKIIVSFKNRLLLLNTIENDHAMSPTNTAYPQRCRYSHLGSPLSVTAWYEPNQVDASGNIADGAGYIDASTEEQIVSAEFIKDRLIVYFERSTWEIVYTGNEVYPFRFQKINTELGADAQFSVVPFDKVILVMSNTGVHACNGSNVERIDLLIPQQIFAIANKSSGTQRVAGIRDYYTEMVYWTFPTNERASEVFPNRILVFNYRTNSWAFYDDCITAWGYFEQQLAETWASTQGTWQENTQTWNSPVEQAQFRQIIAGNQEGYMFVVDSNQSNNASVMQITNMTWSSSTQLLTLTIINHTLGQNDFINISDANGVTLSGTGIYQVQAIVDENTVTAGPVTTFSGTYTGGGTVARVSNIQIMTKQFNPYVDKGLNVYVYKVDFGVLNNAVGEITVDYYTSSAPLSMVEEAKATNMILGNSILEMGPYALYPLEQYQSLLWHPVYFQSEGEFIQLYLYMSDEQMMTPEISLNSFELEAFILNCTPVSTRLQ